MDFPSYMSEYSTDIKQRGIETQESVVSVLWCLEMTRLVVPSAYDTWDNP